MVGPVVELRAFFGKLFERGIAMCPRARSPPYTTPRVRYLAPAPGTLAAHHHTHGQAGRGFHRVALMDRERSPG